MKELLIVGAGITGSLTASLLSKVLPSLSLTVWDKARGAGGRMSTHRNPHNASLHIDMGAQYISRFQHRETDGTFHKLKEDTYSELLTNHVLQPLCGVIDSERRDPNNPIECNYVAPMGMNSIAKYFLSQSKATVSFQQHLTGVDVKENQLHCRTADGIAAVFDALLLTMPVPQILALQGSLMQGVDPAIRTNLETVTYSSRYALGLVFREKPKTLLKGSWSAKYVSHPIIRFASWDCAKRNSESGEDGETLLVHTSVPFAKEHLETHKDVVQRIIQEALDEVLPDLPPAQHSHLIRWRYSQVSTPYPACPGMVLLSEHPLVVATGDGFVGSNFENCLRAAYNSSQTVVQHVLPLNV